MQKVFQMLLFAFGAISMIFLIGAIVASALATTHGSAPARIDNVTAGPYRLEVSLYDYPANAGFALPFAIAPQAPAHGPLTYSVSSIPGHGVHATPVRASFNPDPNTPGGVQGNAEITVHGQWSLHITVAGPAGQGVVDVPVVATALPAIPSWLGWFLGLIPLYGICGFLLVQRQWKGRQEKFAVTNTPSAKVSS